MATKMVGCPECGAAAVPGRYACAECGSLLAAVMPGTRPTGSEPGPEETTGEPTTHVPSAVATSVTNAQPVAPVVAPDPETDPERAAAAEPPVQGPDPVRVASAVEPDVLHGWTPHEGARTEPAPTEATWAEAPASVAPSGLRSAGDQAEPAAWAPVPLAPSAAPAWPPEGDRGVHPMPTVRTPAGAYLPPSAVLDALDPTSATGAVGGAPASSAAPSSSAVGRTTSSASLRRALGSFELAEDTPRAVIAVGAAIGAIGFLLPWANVLAGAGLLGGYFTQWGLAGPGHWIALTLLVATVGVALAGPPTARWPVGLGAITLAALVVGMMWPYLFGFLGRSIGIWVVLAGAIVLVVGGVLDRIGRHDPDGPAVP